MPDDHSHRACLSQAENDGNGSEDKHGRDETTQKTVNEASNRANEAGIVNEWPERAFQTTFTAAFSILLIPAHGKTIEGSFQEENVRFNDKEPEGNGEVGNEIQGPGIGSRNGEEANPEDNAEANSL